MKMIQLLNSAQKIYSPRPAALSQMKKRKRLHRKIEMESQHCQMKQNRRIMSSHYLMKMFLDYLMSPVCGKQDEAASKQCSQEVKCILSVIDKENNITSLFDRLLIRDAILKRYAKQKNILNLKQLNHILKVCTTSTTSN